MPVTDLAAAFDGLPEPADLSRPSDRLIGELLSHVPGPVVMSYATSLLDGAEPTQHRVALRYLGGGHANLLLQNPRGERELRELALWPAVWGARAMQYVWAPAEAAGAARLVVEHLADDRWRVAEMCSKVVGKHEIAEGADALLALTTHRLPRVRMNAVRALGRVAEREHLGAVGETLHDPDMEVRRAAAKAMELRADQLDLDLDDLIGGRPVPGDGR